MARSGDPMSGLLAGLGGIDPSLFQRPQAMKDMKTKLESRGSAADANKASFAQNQTVTLQNKPQPTSKPPLSSALRSPEPAAKPIPDKAATRAAPSPPKDPFSDSSFSSLLGEGNFTKHGRPMRPAAKAVTASAPSLAGSDWTIDAQSAKSESLPEELVVLPTASYTSQRSSTAAAAAAVPASAPLQRDPFEAVSAAQAARPVEASALPDLDPFDFFGGQPAVANPTQAAPPADLLQGFDGSSGITDHSAMHGPFGPVSSGDVSRPDTAVGRSFPPSVQHSSPDGKAAATPASEAALLRPRHAAPHSATAPHSSSSPPDWHALEPAATPFAQSAAPEGRPAARSGPGPAAGEEGRQRRRSREGSPPHSAFSHASPPVSARSGEGDWQRSAHASPPVSARSGGGDRLLSVPAREERQQKGAGATADGYGYDVEPAPRAHRHRQELSAEGSQDAQQAQAPAWLANSQKWLKSAGKKVAQAAKETTATLQARLEEFEQAHRPTHKGGAERANSFSESDAPAYFHDWAAKIESMPPDRAASTLDALAEQDRLRVQRIIDENAMERTRARGSPRSPNLPSTRSRRSDAVSRSIALQSPQSYPDSPRSFEDDSRQAEAMSRDLHAALSSPRKSMQRRDSDASTGSMPSLPASQPVSRRSLAEPSGASPPRRPEPHSPPPQPQPQPQPQPTAARSEPPAADFLGFSEGPGLHARSPTSDLMGLGPEAGPRPPASHSDSTPGSAFGPPAPHAPPPAAQQRAPADDLDIFASPAAPVPVAPASSPADIFGTAFQAGGRAQAAPPAQARAPPPDVAAAAAMMMDFGDDAPAAAGMAAAGDMDVEGEPELRRELRAQRLARTRARMQEQLAEKQERDAREDAEREQKGDLRTAIRPRIEAWQSGKKDNIRALLASLDTVLWEGSGWTKPGMADLVDKSRVKKAYMRANLIVHPDKVAQKGGSIEQVVIADMAFDALKTAWAKFEAGELRA